MTPTSVDVQVLGDVGMVGCAENITATSDGDVGVAVAQATNLFLRTAEGWRMFHHHSSPRARACHTAVQRDGAVGDRTGEQERRRAR